MDHLPLVASMGPPPFGGGNPEAPRMDHLPLVASMGPPPFGGGNYSARLPTPSVVPLQWGHRLSAVETT